MSDLLERKKRLAKAIQVRKLIDERAIQSDLGAKGRPGGLLRFIEYFWHVLEPNTPLVIDMQMEAICLHLEAVTRGEIKKLIINVSPGAAKSLIVNVFWPAWEWSAAVMPHLRYVTFAYASHLTERDNGRFRDVVTSAEFRALWGNVFHLVEDGKIKPVNNKRGWKFSSSIRGVGTGERGDRILGDDLHSVKEAESEAVRSETVRWAREGMSNRLNDMQEGVIVLIGQRVHDEDVSAAMIADKLGYVVLRIPMEYEPAEHCKTAWWEDPRREYGELASPRRFPPLVVSELKRTLGPYAWSSQYQQRPEPRGGGILKRDWWGLYEIKAGQGFRHPFEFRLASLDPAYTARQENDPSGFSVWAVYLDQKRNPKIILLSAWEKWLELHGQDVEKKPMETEGAYIKRAKEKWGLVEWVAYECRRFKVHNLLIENKASGHSVAQEIRRLYADEQWGVRLIDPGAQDKRARAYSIQHLFANAMIEAPGSIVDGKPVFRDFAQFMIDQAAKFRGLPGDEDNALDSLTQALRFLRDTSWAQRTEEVATSLREQMTHKSRKEPIYQV